MTAQASNISSLQSRTANLHVLPRLSPSYDATNRVAPRKTSVTCKTRSAIFEAELLMIYLPCSLSTSRLEVITRMIKNFANVNRVYNFVARMSYAQISSIEMFHEIAVTRISSKSCIAQCAKGDQLHCQLYLFLDS